MVKQAEQVVERQPKNKKEEIIDVTPKATEVSPQDRKQAKLDELMTYLRTGSGYLITVTTISNGKLNHHLITQDFPEVDILKSIAAAEKLATERLKNL